MLPDRVSNPGPLTYGMQVAIMQSFQNEQHFCCGPYAVKLELSNGTEVLKEGWSD